MPSRRLLRHTFPLVAGLFVCGCRANARDVEHWQRTEQGPRKLAALAGSSRYDAELRARALFAMITMEPRTPTGTDPAADGSNPVASFSAALERLARSNDPTLGELVAALVPAVERSLSTPPQPGTPPAGASVRVKDAAVVLARRADTPTKLRLVTAVMAWFTADFGRRATAGEWDAAECAREFGPAAAALLLPAVDPKLDKDVLPQLARAIAEGADAELRTRAALRFIVAEREMEAPPYAAWVDTEVKRALASAGHQPTPAQLASIVGRTRESYVTTGGIGALKAFAADAAVRARLLEIAQRKSPTPDEDGRRVEALSALGGNVDVSHASALLALALDATNPGAVRELAFDRLAETRDRGVLPQLYPLVAVTGEGTDPEVRKARQLRARCAELLLQLGVAPADFFAKLPTAPAAPFDPGELQGYANRLAELTPAPDAVVRAELRSPIWWRRVVAIHYVARTGSRADRALIEALATDTTPTVGDGFRNRNPAEDTVGKVATAALVGMDDRLSQPPAR